MHEFCRQTTVASYIKVTFVFERSTLKSKPLKLRESIQIYLSMQNSELNIEHIKNLTTQGIACQFLPSCFFGPIIPLLENIPGSEGVILLILLLILILFGCGYGICAAAADKYAAYKGYKNPLFIYSILNIFGLSILYLLWDRNHINRINTRKESLNLFSIRTIFASYFIISILIVTVLLIATFILTGEVDQDYIQNNKNFIAFFEITVTILTTWYFIKEFKEATLDYKHILGSLRRINFKLPIGIAIVEFLFVWGINPITLYGLSFVVPEYVEQRLNYEYATTPIGWIFFAITALIYAPIMEELFYRGIIFQKIALKKGFVPGLSISAILFTVMHFRYDVIPLCMMGIIFAILYFKTKQLIVPIICHFTYNLIVVVRRLSNQLFFDTDSTMETTVAVFQQKFLDNLEIYILLLTVSVPYLIYFIYKNYPRNYKVDKLPYFINQ